MTDVPEDEKQISVDIQEDLLKLFRQYSGYKFDWKNGYIKKGIHLAIIHFLESEGIDIPQETIDKTLKILEKQNP